MLTEIVLAAVAVLAGFVCGFASARLRTRRLYAFVTLGLLSLAAIFALGTMLPRVLRDLSGGIVLTYEVKGPATPAAEQPARQDTMDDLARAVERRLEYGVATECSARAQGDGQIQITLRGAGREDAEEAQRRLAMAGTIEFLIVCNREDHEDRGYKFISKAAALPLETDELRDPAAPDLVLARWVPIDEEDDYLRQAFSPPRPGELVNDLGRAVRVVQRDGKETVQALCRTNPNFYVDDTMLAGVSPGVDSTGGPCVDVRFNELGARRMRLLTQNNLSSVDRRCSLAVVLNGKLKSAPSIEGVISGEAELHGYGNTKERDAILGVLRSGRFPRKLGDRPLTVQDLSPTVSRETLQIASVPLGVVVLVAAAFFLGRFVRRRRKADDAAVPAIIVDATQQKR